MKTVRKFIPADRYLYDFGPCASEKGFAQIDTSQDASYFGTWANPEKMQIVTYCEGDITIQTAETKDEFVNAIFDIKFWNEENGHTFYGIDCLLNEELIERFKALGLEKLLH